jgi:hypothetical protein
LEISKGLSEAVNQRKTDKHNGKIKRKIRIKVTMIEKTRYRNIQIEYKKKPNKKRGSTHVVLRKGKLFNFKN